MTYQEWYEGTFPDKRAASTKRDQEGVIHRPAKKKAETLAAEGRERRVLKSSNRCGSCFMTMPVGTGGLCDCGWQRPPVKKFEPKDGRVYRV